MEGRGPGTVTRLPEHQGQLTRRCRCDRRRTDRWPGTSTTASSSRTAAPSSWSRSASSRRTAASSTRCPPSSTPARRRPGCGRHVLRQAAVAGRTRPGGRRARIRDDLCDFLAAPRLPVELWAWYAAYDHVVLAPAVGGDARPAQADPAVHPGDPAALGGGRLPADPGAGRDRHRRPGRCRGSPAPAGRSAQTGCCTSEWAQHAVTGRRGGNATRSGANIARARLDDVNWTVDIPADILPTLPPLAGRPAAPAGRRRSPCPPPSSRSGPTPSRCSRCGPCWRPCRR